MKYINVSVKKSEYHKVTQWCHDTFGDCNSNGNGNSNTNGNSKRKEILEQYTREYGFVGDSVTNAKPNPIPLIEKNLLN